MARAAASGGLCRWIRPTRNRGTLWVCPGAVRKGRRSPTPLCWTPFQGKTLGWRGGCGGKGSVVLQGWAGAVPDRLRALWCLPRHWELGSGAPEITVTSQKGSSGTCAGASLCHQRPPRCEPHLGSDSSPHGLVASPNWDVMRHQDRGLVSPQHQKGTQESAAPASSGVLGAGGPRASGFGQGGDEIQMLGEHSSAHGVFPLQRGTESCPPPCSAFLGDKLRNPSLCPHSELCLEQWRRLW